LAVALALLLPIGATGQTAQDGDSLRWQEKRIRLHGIDAPELTQTCDDGTWPAGILSRDALAAFLNNRQLVCEARGRDAYGRTIANCTADGTDLAGLMVAAGWAWTFTRYSTAYVEAEQQAATKRLGVHGHRCEMRWDWRRQHRR
jgi:endonuclease YncB( thermonuclease family)